MLLTNQLDVELILKVWVLNYFLFQTNKGFHMTSKKIIFAVKNPELVIIQLLIQTTSNQIFLEQFQIIYDPLYSFYLTNLKENQ